MFVLKIYEGPSVIFLLAIYNFFIFSNSLPVSLHLMHGLRQSFFPLSFCFCVSLPIKKYPLSEMKFYRKLAGFLALVMRISVANISRLFVSLLSHLVDNFRTLSQTASALCCMKNLIIFHCLSLIATLYKCEWRLARERTLRQVSIKHLFVMI